MIALAVFYLVTDTPIYVDGSPNRGDLLQLIVFFYMVGFGALCVCTAVFAPPDFRAPADAVQQGNESGADIDIGHDW